MDSIESGSDILRGLADAVVAYDEEKTVELAKMALVKDIDPSDAILKDLPSGWRRWEDFTRCRNISCPSCSSAPIR